MTKMTMLGTGHAMVTKCYNTCFLLQNESGAILIDAGGGNEILTQMEKVEAKWNSLRALFITHMHTDHILGAVWVLRKINSMMKHGGYQGDFNVYGLQEGLDFLMAACEGLLSDKLNDRIHFLGVKDRDVFSEISLCFRVFDIHSTKMQQIGFRVEIPSTNNKTADVISLVCLGDEPYSEKCREYVKDADWLLHEAFCLYKDRELFKPYEKHHSTALDAGKVASDLNIKNLVLYHTEDTDLLNRREKYKAEAGTQFQGEIYVPMDLETIVF